MIAPGPLTPIFICHEPVNFRMGIDGLVAYCRQIIEQDPFSGACFVFRNRRADCVRLLFYVEDGWWLCTKRFSQGKLTHWPESGSTDAGRVAQIAARELSVLLWKGSPQGAQFPPFWKKIPSPARAT